MKRISLCVVLSLVLIFSLLNITAFAQGANSDPSYVALRHIQVGSETFAVQNLKLVRDIGTFELKSGTICLLQPVNGVVTGAVFRGDGTFHLQSDDPREQNQMKMLTKEAGITEEFETLVLMFADDTPAELREKLEPSASAGGCDTALLEDHAHFLRVEVKSNLAARLLQPVLAGKPDGFFAAFFKGKKYGRMAFEVDPAGIDEVRPEEVALFDFAETKAGIWYAGHLAGEARKGWRVKKTNHPTGFVKAVNHKIDASIEKSGTLTATSTETLTSQVDGLRVVPLDLFPRLRVSAVKDGAGTALGWIQEKKDEDADLAVVLAKPAAKGEQIVITTTYSGKDAVLHEGDGNYYPVARDNWYPNTFLGDYANYQLTLRIPKGLDMAATGALVSGHNEGNQNVTEWKSEVPLSVAGFNFGNFKSESVTPEKTGVKITASVNREIPDAFKGFLTALDTQRLDGPARSGEMFPLNAPMGTLSTLPMLKKSLAEADTAVRLYTSFFGPLPYKDLLVTQQTAGNYGQAWPGLVYIPIFYYLDTTQRNLLGLTDPKGEYWKVVEPHEVAHEWFGHTVNGLGYRDDWMNEGFAEFSASLFIQYVRSDRKFYASFWKNERDNLCEKDQFGKRPNDVGAVTMGHRTSTGKVSGWTGTKLIYPKGAYILNMLRWMMYTQQKGDADFKVMMQDLLTTYRSQSITTEDFKAMVEKHMTPSMNADGNGKMDWFFDEWVYGTEIPSYTSESTPAKTPDGKPAITLSITQSGVSPNFKMVVPVYYEMPDGRVGKLGQALLVGNQTMQQLVPVPDNGPKRLFINYNYDVLSAN